MQGEGIDVNDDRLLAGLRDDLRELGDLVALASHQQHVHILARGVLADDFVIEVHVIDVERDVLLGFPVNLFVQFFAGHLRQQYLFDNDGVARQRRGDLIGLDVVVRPDAVD